MIATFEDLVQCVRVRIETGGPTGFRVIFSCLPDLTSEDEQKSLAAIEEILEKLWREDVPHEAWRCKRNGKRVPDRIVLNII